MLTPPQILSALDFKFGRFAVVSLFANQVASLPTSVGVFPTEGCVWFTKDEVMPTTPITSFDEARAKADASYSRVHLPSPQTFTEQLVADLGLDGSVAITSRISRALREYGTACVKKGEPPWSEIPALLIGEKSPDKPIDLNRIHIISWRDGGWGGWPYARHGLVGFIKSSLYPRVES